MKKMRTWFAADKTGFHMLHTLFQTSLQVRARSPATTSGSSPSCWSRTAGSSGVVGDRAAHRPDRAIAAKAVILCTGGCGRVFPFTTNANIKTGDGMALAYRAGAPLKDMEFVQYHPTGLPFTGILITEAARAEGGWLLNKDGYRYLQDYDLGKPERRRRCCAAWSWVRATGCRRRSSRRYEKGRTIDGPYGPVVHLDLRHLGEKVIDSQAAVRARAVPEVRGDRSGAASRSRCGRWCTT